MNLASAGSKGRLPLMAILCRASAWPSPRDPVASQREAVRSRTKTAKLLQLMRTVQLALECRVFDRVVQQVFELIVAVDHVGQMIAVKQ